MGKLFGRQNPNFVQADQLRHVNSRQPKAIPTLGHSLTNLAPWSKSVQQKLKHVQLAPPAPATPSNFAAVGIVGAIKLSWGQVTGADGYILLKNSSPDFSLPGAIHINLRNPKQTTFIDSTVGDSVWWYQVVATSGTSSQPQLAQSVPTSIVSATALPTTPSFGKQLVPNAGFEQNVVGTTVNTPLSQGQPVSDGWSVYQANNNQGVFSIELENSGSSRSGAQNVLFRINQNISAPTGQSFAQVASTAKLPLAVGDIVRVSAWIALAHSATLANFLPSGVFGLLIFDANGNFLSYLNFVNASPSASYQFFQSAVTIPATVGGGVPAYCQFYIQGNLQNNTGGAVNTGGNLYGDIRFDDVRCVIQNTAFDLTPINTSGQPRQTTSPLTQASSASHQINIGATTWQFGDGQVSYNSGSVDPGSFGTWYIYADDPTFSGGAVAYQATQNPYDTIAVNGRLYFGQITTVNGSVATGTGGGTGGGGAGSKSSLR